MKISTYLLSVRCRLSLPRKVKQQELNRLREKIFKDILPGENPEPYLRHLGSPGIQAARIQAQHPEFKKSPWRWLFLLAAVLSLLGLLWPRILKIFSGISLAPGSVYWIPGASEAASMGIIGGADGPTSVYVTTAPIGIFPRLCLIAITILGFFGYLRFRHCKSK